MTFQIVISPLWDEGEWSLLGDGEFETEAEATSAVRDIVGGLESKMLLDPALNAMWAVHKIARESLRWGVRELGGERVSEVEL